MLELQHLRLVGRNLSSSLSLGNVVPFKVGHDLRNAVLDGLTASSHSTEVHTKSGSFHSLSTSQAPFHSLPSLLSPCHSLCWELKPVPSEVSSVSCSPRPWQLSWIFGDGCTTDPELLLPLAAYIEAITLLHVKEGEREEKRTLGEKETCPRL